MDKLAQHNRDKLIDLLTERLAFERATGRLYDIVLERLDSSGAVQPLHDQMHRYRSQEKEHETWLEQQIAALGGSESRGSDGTAELVERESMEIQQTTLVEEFLPRVLHALLTSELVDNAGWELLVELADDADDREARADFRKRLHEEEEHLLFVRAAMLTFARRDVLGYERHMEA